MRARVAVRREKSVYLFNCAVYPRQVLRSHLDPWICLQLLFYSIAQRLPSPMPPVRPMRSVVNESEGGCLVCASSHPPNPTRSNSGRHTHARPPACCFAATRRRRGGGVPAGSLGTSAKQPGHAPSRPRRSEFEPIRCTDFLPLFLLLLWQTPRASSGGPGGTRAKGETMSGMAEERQQRDRA